MSLYAYCNGTALPCFYCTNEINFLCVTSYGFVVLSEVLIIRAKKKAYKHLYLYFSIFDIYLMIADLDNRNMLQCITKALILIVYILLGRLTNTILKLN
jgi:hypothetical protein